MALSAIRNSRNRRFRQLLEYCQVPQDPACPWVALESPRHIADLVESVPIELLLYSRAGQEKAEVLLPAAQEVQPITSRLLRRLSQVKSSQGIMAFFAKPKWSWAQVRDHLVVLCGIQDPGNLGTVIRSAAATGIFSVATSMGTVSVHNPKVIRASAASLFWTPCLEQVTLEDLRNRQYQIYAADPSAANPYEQVRYSSRSAILIGQEGSGLEGQNLSPTDVRVGITSDPRVKSLNAATAAALLLFEVVRQQVGQAEKRLDPPPPKHTRA